jgi:copper chaperone CopZ
VSTVQTPEIAVTDATCNGCEDTIQDELRHEPGVRRVSANHVEETVEGTADVDVDAPVRKITAIGFTASAYPRRDVPAGLAGGVRPGGGPVRTGAPAV